MRTYFAICGPEFSILEILLILSKIWLFSCDRFVEVQEDAAYYGPGFDLASVRRIRAGRRGGRSVSLGLALEQVQQHGLFLRRRLAGKTATEGIGQACRIGITAFAKCSCRQRLGALHE